MSLTFVKNNVIIIRHLIERKDGENSTIESTFELKNAKLTQSKTSDEPLSVILKQGVDQCLGKDGHWIPEDP